MLRRSSHPKLGARAPLLAALTTIVCALAASLAAAPAQAYNVQGKRWPGGTITVRNLTSFSFAVPEAMRRWNAVGMPVRFKATKSKRANVVIRASGPKGTGNSLGACAGYATVGYTRFFQSRMDLLASCDDDLFTASVIAHELGHVLGLGHERKQCALMNPSLFNGVPEVCKVPDIYASGVWRCRVIEPDDIAGVRKLYKGAPKAPSTIDCPVFGAPPAPAIAATFEPLQVYQPILVTLPAAPQPLLRISSITAPQPKLLLAAALDACPAADAPVGVGAGFAEDQSWALWGEPRTVYPSFQLTAGRWCLAAWTVTPQGRSAPATMWLESTGRPDGYFSVG